MTVGLVLGGGAPNITIMSGALAALDEKNVTFDVISTSGAGMLVGLLYAAPKNCSRQEALALTKDMSVSNAINRVFPIDYKVFQKPGPLADAYRKLTDPWLNQLPYNTKAEKLTKDWLAFLAAMFCPSDLTPWSKGLCATAPWVGDIVDFEALRDFAGEFYVSGFNIDTYKMDRFNKNEITADHFRACLAMPFIYPPYELNNQTYIEGAVYKTLDYEALYEEKPKVDHAIVFDVLSQPKIIQKPKNLYDALSQMIIVPLIRLGILDTKAMKAELSKQGIGYHRLKYSNLVPEDHWPQVLEWSEHNMTTLYDIGYEAGKQFYDENKEILNRKPSATVTQLEGPKYKKAG